MGWFWADAAQAGRPSACPVKPSPPPPSTTTDRPSACPVKHSSTSSAAPLFAPVQTGSPSACPVKHSSSSSTESSVTPSYISKLNPLNYMPTHISNQRSASSPQSISLPLDREASTIPRGDGQGTWEYPSPQQMYNAMLRKGYTDTPAEHVESMVAVHNFLNEGAWEEIKEWERRFSGGLAKGWDISRRGEEGAARQAFIEELRRSRQMQSEDTEPKLLRFMGRPSDLTPKARMLSFMAWVYPSQFPNNPPFDRHDWFVERHVPGGKNKEVRYVIDYYSGPPEPTGEPVFYLDVRPAVDGPTAACERAMRWGGDVWYRATGGSVREELAKKRRDGQ